MYIKKLLIKNFRNIDELKLLPEQKFNFIIGENGSGKSTVLETIYCLSTGHSFRSRNYSAVIQYNAEKLSCFAELSSDEAGVVKMGIEKSQTGNFRAQIDGEPCKSVSALARALITQILSPDTFKLLTHGPEARRRYIDWGVFHVEHSYAAVWRRYGLVLKQRNAALKQRAAFSVVRAWDQELIELGESLSKYRQDYLQALLPSVVEILEGVLPGSELKFAYQCGWPGEEGLAAAISDTWDKDQRYGYTTVGPHRADLSINVRGFAAQNCLSRGQQKLLICVLLIGQVALLAKQTGQRCVFLVDDLGSELDAVNLGHILKLLAEQDCQCFATGIDTKIVDSLKDGISYQMFHVEHGCFV